MTIVASDAERHVVRTTSGWDRSTAILLWSAAVLVVLYGAFIIWRYAWLDIYADQWYIYGILLSEPFPENALRAVNGHRIVIPNLIRLVELHWLGGDQTLQRACGVVFATGTVLLFWRVFATERNVRATARGGAALVVALSIFWLANGRMLLHAAESTQIYFVIFMLALASVALAPLAHAPATPSGARVWGATLCGLLAAMSFGYGIVLFPAALATLIIVRAPPRSMLPLVVGVALALVLYLVTPGSDGVPGMAPVGLLDYLSVGLRWLGTPIAQVLRPFIDPAHAPAYLGAWWDESITDGARQFDEAYGSIDKLFWLPLCAGGAGVGLACWYSWRTWRTRECNRMGLAGLMLVWFGLGASGVIALTRSAFFSANPLQIATERYLPLPTLFWAGVLLLALASVLPTARQSLGGRVKLVLTCVLCAQVFATNAAWRVWATQSQSMIRTQNLMLAVGVMPPASWLGETPAVHLVENLPLIRQHRVGLFGHPAVDSLGLVVHSPIDASLGVGELTMTQIDAPEGEAAALIDIDMTAFTRSVRAPIWLLLDDRDRAIGLAAPHPLRSTRRLRGVVRGEGDLVPHRAVPWAPNLDQTATALALRYPSALPVATPAPR
jgi:hypothetical protein